MSMDAPVMYGALNVPGLAGVQADQIQGRKRRKQQAFFACQGMLHKYLAAVRDDQFLVG
jgi:hypothetical protein